MRATAALAKDGHIIWLFSDTVDGAKASAVIYSLMLTCRASGVDPLAWLADVLHRIAGYPAHRIDELLPWNWKSASPAAQMLAA